MCPSPLGGLRGTGVKEGQASEKAAATPSCQLSSRRPLAAESSNISGDADNPDLLWFKNLGKSKLNFKKKKKTLGRPNKTHSTSVGWVQPEGCQRATSAEIWMDRIHGSTLIYQPSHPIKGRSEVQCGLDYQCFLRKVLWTMNSTLDFKGGRSSDGASPEACHLLNISLYLACAKEGAALGQQLKIRPLSHDAPANSFHPLPPLPPWNSSFTPPFCLSPGSLGTCWPPTPPPPQSPVRGGVYPSNSSSLAEAALKAMVWVVTSTSCYVTLYFTMLVSPFIYPSSPLSIHQYIFCSDIFASKLCPSVYFPSSTWTLIIFTIC